MATSFRGWVMPATGCTEPSRRRCQSIMAYIPASETREPDYQIVIPSLLQRLNEIEDLTERVAAEHHMSEDDRDNLAIAITETVNNAMIHGNKLDPKKNVIISFYFDTQTLRVYIRDQGVGFDPSHVGNPLDPENIMKESGRGIFILRSIMDGVDFIRLNDGTEVRITKKVN